MDTFGTENSGICTPKKYYYFYYFRGTGDFGDWEFGERKPFGETVFGDWKFGKTGRPEKQLYYNN